MEHVLKYVKKVVNFIHSGSLNQHQFSGFLKDSIDQLCDDNWRQDLAFMIDMTGHFNDLNLSLPRKRSAINFNSHNASDFSQYTFNVNELINEFESRFKDSKHLKMIYLCLVVHFPLMFKRQIAIATLLKIKFNEVGIPKFYSYLPSQCSEMHQFAAVILAMFGYTYLCEQLFLLKKANTTSRRSRLTTHFSSILKIASSQNLVADIETLVSKKGVNLKYSVSALPSTRGFHNHIGETDMKVEETRRLQSYYKKLSRWMGHRVIIAAALQKS
ncbi:hypothetical protein PR048_019154 [Dryococelus australis]|uniref:Uncharacterized protein n=1 Tax=Dryococelus australis TaxID=614101 RepID=A0ABQ9H2R2_9NEOP|nr:hypothetical protein PR048_019154 [Dryococelus australis]